MGCLFGLLNMLWDEGETQYYRQTEYRQILNSDRWKILKREYLINHQKENNLPADQFKCVWCKKVRL